MSGLIEGYNYDIFISYRQKDNKGDHWVSEFVEALKTELESTFKEEISVYFDINPHDGLLETHDVDASLKEKLRCLIFIPIISRTYCDPKCFAWEHEFRAFVEMASKDQFGLKVRLANGNVASRVLPVRIHELGQKDIKECEDVIGSVLRGIEFIYTEPGVNKPLTPGLNSNKYSIQINKVANAIEEILTGLKNIQFSPSEEKVRNPDVPFLNQGKIKRGTIKNKRNLLGSAIFLMAIVITVFLVKRRAGSDSFESMTRAVKIINEDGQKEIHRVFKESYVTKLSLFPFENVNDDTTDSWQKYGFMMATSSDLSQFNYLSLTAEPVTNLQEQIKFARNNNSKFFISGSYKVSDGIYDVTSRIYQTSNGKTVSERKFRGNDFFSLIDSISLSARYDLNIPDIILNKFTDLPFKEQTTNSISAYQNYIIGAYQNSIKSIGYLNKSIEIDSTFALALYELAVLLHWNQLNNESACELIERALRHRHRLSDNNELSIRILNNFIHGDTASAVELAERRYEVEPNTFVLDFLIRIYDASFLIPKLESTSERLNKILPGRTSYQLMLGKSYLFSGKYDKGLDLMNQLLDDSPENVDALSLMAEMYLHKKEFMKAEECYQQAIFIRPELKNKLSWIPDYISFMRQNDIKSDFLIKFTGNYRSENTEQYLNCFLNNDHLFYKLQTQMGSYSYPVSESDFIAAYTVSYFDDYNVSSSPVKHTFIRDCRDKITKVMLHQADYDHIYWKEDSLISRSLKLMKDNNKNAALDAFRDAWSQNPDHYYLKNFIQHLEFIQSDLYKKTETKSDLLVGKYGSISISRKMDILYYKDSIGLSLKLLPLDEYSFMTPGSYSRTFRIISRKNKISGIEVLNHNGEKKFYTKND